MAVKFSQQTWNVQAEDPPKLSSNQWGALSLLGAVFLVMAVAQLISFNDFKAALNLMGLSSEGAWGALIILAEVGAAVGFFKLRLSALMRTVSGVLALLASGFWFITNIRLVAEGSAGLLPNSGYFGKYLQQSPGWWTVIEATIAIAWVIYSLELVKSRLK